MQLFANLSALAGFFDDLVEVDVKNPNPGPREEVQTVNLNEYGRIADPSGLALHLLDHTRRLLPPADVPAFDHFIQRVFTVEIQGRQQNGSHQAHARGNLHPESPGLNFDLLKQITAEKGGCSVLLFRRALAHPMPEAEQQALFEFGAFVQLCDDIFDLWFDRQNGTVTLATAWAERHDPERLCQIFENQVGTVRQTFRQMPYPKRRVETALGVVHFLVAITRVCLCHYIDLQKKRGTLPLDSRADMVVDMDRWRNRWRAGVQIWRY